MHIDNIKPTAAVALADMARELELTGISIIKLQTGDPDFDTHPAICDAATRALDDGLTHYSFSQGIPQLRSEIARELNNELSSELITKEWVLITNGAAEGIYSVMAALLEINDEVIILEPNWPTVDSLATLLGGKTRKVNSLNDAATILEDLEDAYSDHTKILCFNSPNNPTGIVYDQQLINDVCHWAKQKGLYILADEVYRFLQYSDFPSTSISNIIEYDRYIFVDSFSKKFAMTGWRIGYISANPTTLKKIAKASQLTVTHVAPFVQMAALTALTDEQSLNYCNMMRESYNKRRLALIDYCNSLKLEFLLPEGGFYLFVYLGSNINDVDFCNKMLNESQTCIVPGSAFGKSGENYIRISFATELEKAIEGIKRISTMISILNND